MAAVDFMILLFPAMSEPCWAKEVHFAELDPEFQRS